jgi:diguanylate cyclase (GGDEF)-like protein
MRMAQIVERYPTLLAQFLDLSGTSILLLTDEEYTVTFCNDGLMRKMHLPQKPVGAHIGSVLCPLEDGELSLIVSRQANGLVPQIFRLCYTEILFRCYSHKIEGGYLVLGDRVGSTENEIIESMAHLNNELSAMSRELSKKNRELQRANAKIVELSRTDPLTGLSNRRYFQERFQEGLAMAKRHGLDLSLLLMDLDNFKRINDTHGHTVGDKVLQSFGRIIAATCRTEDLPARFGGEEFIVLMPQTSGREAQAVEERLRSRIAETGALPAPDGVTFSAGIVQYAKGDSEESMISNADRALYEAKSSGRNRCVIFRA